MIKIMIWLAMQGPAYRQSNNVYAIPGHGTVETKNCTVSANGELQAVATRDWIYFYDRHGELEADCELLKFARPTVEKERLTIQRAIATVE